MTVSLLASSKAYWYLTRGTGAVLVVLLTTSVVLGIANSVRWSPEPSSRYVLQRVHRNVSLLVLAFLGIHITTAVLDTFAPIHWLDAIVPFTGSYRPIWLGLGAVAFDLLLAVVLTSLLRGRMKFRSWKAVHWLAYGAWASALVHGVGIGSDTKQTWMLGLLGVSVLAVMASLLWRASRGWASWEPARILMVSGAVLMAPLLVLWMRAGPLQGGWALAAGTPTKLLKTAVATSARPAGPTEAPLVLPSQANFDGTSDVANSGSSVTLTVNGKTTGPVPLQLMVTVKGTMQATGGLGVSSGSVELTPPQGAATYRGTVTGLSGGNLLATLNDGHGDTIDVSIALTVPGQGSATGQIAISNGQTQA